MYIIKLSGKIAYNKAVYRAAISKKTLFPGRTYFADLAKRYKLKRSAKSALTQLRNRNNKTYADAEILEV